MAVAARSRMTSTSSNCEANRRHGAIGFSAASSLRPYRLSRARTSSTPRPRCRSVLSAATTSSTLFREALPASPSPAATPSSDRSSAPPYAISRDGSPGGSTIAVSRVACAVLACVAIAVAQPSTSAQSTTARLPARLEHYLKDVIGATSAERARLMDGAPITRLLEGDPSKEVAAFGAIWINAPIRRYIEAVQDIENFERGKGFLVTKRISAPPRLEDFAALRLPSEDVADLRTCRVGNCDVKLGEQALQRFRTEIDWKSPRAQDAADALMRRLALDYVTGYLEGGNARLAVYRDDSQPTFVAEEFRAMVAQMPELAASMPAIRRY